MSAGDAARPNVLWVCTDQQRWDTLGCYGNEFVDTPNVDRLASEGVRFDRAYCQNPFCTPSRASFLTGRYPRTTGVRTNGYPVPEDETLVTTALAEAGYRCGLSGKLHLSPEQPHDDADVLEEPTRRVRDGYSSFHWASGSHSGAHAEWLAGRDVEPTESDLSEGCPYVSTSVPAEYHQTTWCVDRAVDFLTAHAGEDRPWLFSVNPIDPHAPWNPPASYLERYRDALDDIPLPNREPGELDDKPAAQRRRRDESSGFHVDVPFDEVDDADHRLIRAAYWAMVDLIDDGVGRLLDALEETGQREDTLVLFTSDHGEMLGDHAIYNKGTFFYEGAVRVPLVVSGPGVAAGVESDALVELADLAPTLLDAADVDRPHGMQGDTLWPLLRGEADPDRHRESVYAEQYIDQDPAGADVDAVYTMVRTDRYKLVRSHGTGEAELYDLEADPTETHNLASDPEHADALAEMLALMTDRMSETADPKPERQGDW
ncbi:MAG: sulfatase [Halobacteriaceae archaeon]